MEGFYVNLFYGYPPKIINRDFFKVPALPSVGDHVRLPEEIGRQIGIEGPDNRPAASVIVTHVLHLWDSDLSPHWHIYLEQSTLTDAYR